MQPRHDRTISSSREKKPAVTTSKKLKGPGGSSSRPTLKSDSRSSNSRRTPKRIYFRYYVHDLSESEGGLVRQLSVPEFGTALGLYTEQFLEEENLFELHRHIHVPPINCWCPLVPGQPTYDPSRSKATNLIPSLQYLHALLAHTLTGRHESIGVVSTYDAYFLWSMAYIHVIDLAYFIAYAIQHQTERHRRGVFSIGPYVTRLACHFGLLNTTAQAYSYTLIGQMSP
ncbi:hypothetical protein J1N35_006169 [Gossypium stocksii]|uniref:Uncharacterized protein n=1 Tax=Gossypium stocksii TaxID=47602 RepID=A0A9D3WFE2_9ROSI|nr:hypothetical protein J1N35_006169 [Gossypium stocksii]